MRERRIVRLMGHVVGVGFRDRIVEVATENEVYGHVRRMGPDLEIDVEGRPGDVSYFLRQIIKQRPPGANVRESTIVPGKALGRSEFIREASLPETP